jgi:hypothetical protein
MYQSVLDTRLASVACDTGEIDGGISNRRAYFTPTGRTTYTLPPYPSRSFLDLIGGLTGPSVNT